MYALTTGPITGWGSANCIAPLVISVVLGVVFFIFEAMIPEGIAALPPRVWEYPNVPVLFALGFMPFCWWGTCKCSLLSSITYSANSEKNKSIITFVNVVFFQLQPLMMSVYGWSAIMSSVRFLPCGFAAIVAAVVSPMFVKYWSPKWSITVGLTMQFIGTMLLPFADSKAKFWSHCLPAFIMYVSLSVLFDRLVREGLTKKFNSGSSGTMLVYTTSNIAIFLNTPPEMAGVTGAVFNSVRPLVFPILFYSIHIFTLKIDCNLTDICFFLLLLSLMQALQLGVTLGIAIAASITQSIDQNHTDKGEAPGYSGISASFWFIVAFIVTLFIAVQVFYKVESKMPLNKVDVEGHVTQNERQDRNEKEETKE